SSSNGIVIIRSLNILNAIEGIAAVAADRRPGGKVDRRRRVENYGVDAVATVQMIVARATVEHIVAGIAIQLIIAVTANERVVPGPTRNKIVPATSINVVVALATVQSIEAVLTVNEIVASPSPDTFDIH